jgi:hypothetical protein
MVKWWIEQRRFAFALSIAVFWLTPLSQPMVDTVFRLPPFLRGKST